ncbi:uncharacterized protein si:dkey-220k22.3 [Triplophysa dalaica]|uniref:uncharacterized protein si:dkey-220k22.3 n=1 Tax=Triplophysa dalaica TaxID=1582913 RepID=UPI0024E01E4F|nr:uncharacterized protein si:dkey-220k22.3 [Triplophysa dalaica]
METARRTKAHFIWTSVALVVVIAASCLIYVFLSKTHNQVPTCQKANIVIAPFLFDPTATSLGNICGRKSSREHWLVKAQRFNEKDGRLIWEDEWAENRNKSERILDHTNMWMVIREKGVYLLYIQANFKLKYSEERKLLVDFEYSNGTHTQDDAQIFAAAHDTQVVNSSEVQDAKLNTFLKMDLNSGSRLSVRAFPSDAVTTAARPFSTFITLIKWADDW